MSCAPSFSGSREFVEQLEKVAKRTLAERETMLLFGFVALSILAIETWGWQEPFYEMVRRSGRFSNWPASRVILGAQAWHALFCIAVMVAVPLVFNALVEPLSARQLGLRAPRTASWLPAVVLAWLALVPVLWLASGKSDFRAVYPVFAPSSGQSWVVYLAIRAATLFAVEFFFRGFLLFRLERRFSFSSVPIMALPYSLVHLHKPLLEALASIPGGLALGILALACRSIWPGLMLHMAMALTLDLLV